MSLWSMLRLVCYQLIYNAYKAYAHHGTGAGKMPYISEL